MIGLVTDPDRFYRGAVDDASLSGPIAVVGLWGGMRFLRDLLVGLGGGGVDALALTGSLLLVVVLAVFWVVVSGLLYVVSGQFGAGGGFRPTLRLVGYGFLPAAVGVGLEVLAAGLLVGVGSTNVAGEPLYRVFESGAMDLVFLTWAGFLWTFALKHARGMSVREAAASVVLGLGGLVGVVVALVLLLSVL